MSGAERFVVEKVRDVRASVLANPQSATHWGRMGMVFDVHNLVAEAVVCYREAERLDPDDFRWPYMHSVCLPDAGPEVRAEILRRAAALRPDYGPVNIRWGEALLDVGNLELAKTCFEKAAGQSDVVSHANLGLARVAIKAGQPQQARQLLEAAATANRKHREVFILLARVLQSLNEPAKAQQVAQWAQSLQGKTPIKDPARTEVMFEGATADQLAIQGNRLRQQEKYDESIRRLRMSLEIEPANALARFDLGLGLIAKQEIQSGIAELEKAVDLDDKFQPAQEALKWARTLQ
jgi:tetratricopeptide (TPR) repeat protein